jgi:hypothetical protein
VDDVSKTFFLNPSFVVKRDVHVGDKPRKEAASLRVAEVVRITEISIPLPLMTVLRAQTPHDTPGPYREDS